MSRLGLGAFPGKVQGLRQEEGTGCVLGSEESKKDRDPRQQQELLLVIGGNAFLDVSARSSSLW